MSPDALDKEKEYTHIAIIKKTGEDAQPPVFYCSVKEASDDGEEVIKKFPDAEFDIYQLRTRLRGKVEVIRKDFNSSKTE